MLRKELKQLKGYSLIQPPHRVKLNQNESPWDLPPPLKKGVLKELEKLPWNRYPTPYANRLRDELSRRLRWPADGIVVGDGSNTLIPLLLLATAVGGRVLTVKPGFPLYAFEARLLRNQVVEVPLDPCDFSLPLDRFLKTMRQERPNIIFLANPNAPTGNIFPREALLKIVRAARCLVVIDEAYYPFSGATLKPYLPRFRNLVILWTYSKALGLAGTRLGYLIAHPSVAATIRKVQLPFTVGAVAEKIGLAVLKESRYVSRAVATLNEERDRLFDEMQKIPGVTAYRSSANFILFRVANAAKVYRKLLKRGILIRRISGHGLENCLRVSIGTPRENRLFLTALLYLKF